MVLDYGKLYLESVNYLENKARLHGLSPTDLDVYYVPSICIPGETNINDIRRIYLRLCYHAQNGTIIDRVINFNCNHTQIETVTNNFDVNYVLRTYSNDSDVFRKLEELLCRNGKMVERYAKALYTGAKFLSQFSNYEEFVRKMIGYGELAPTVIQYNVEGFQDTLACDFLKETDVRFDLCKTDQHIVECVICFTDLQKGNGNKFLYQVRNLFNMIKDEINRACGGGISAYKLDKILYLISTERFYRNDDVRNHDDTKRNDYLNHLKALGIIS